MRKRGGRDQQRDRPDRLHVRPILAQVAAGYRYDWKLLLGAGLLVFVPIGLLTALDPLDGNALDEWNGGWSVAFVLLLVAQASIPLLGAVFYSGVVAAGEERNAATATATTFARSPATSPTGHLIFADLALLFVMAVGFIALVIPGFIVITWFALIAPVIEMEGRGVRGAFRRSRAMVRPHFWKVAGIVIPLTFLQALLESGGNAAGYALLGDGYPGNLLGSIVSNFLGSPLYALTVLALYFEITERED